MCVSRRPVTSTRSEFVGEASAAPTSPHRRASARGASARFSLIGALVHGARRRAARADIVVTNHSLLFRNVAADGKILPPIRHWVIDEAHSVEREARRQWACTVSADESRALFERLGGERGGVLGQLTTALAGSDAMTLYMGLSAKAAASAHRASIAMAGLFDAVRDVSRVARGGSYDNVNMWIGPEVRDSDLWCDAFLPPATAAVDALYGLSRNLESLVETIAPDKPEMVVDVADAARRVAEAHASLKLIVDGADERYVYSLQVNRRLRAGERRSRPSCWISGRASPRVGFLR